MPDHSAYHLTCVCGAIIVTQSAECVCPKCGREIRVEWPGDSGISCKGLSLAVPR